MMSQPAIGAFEQSQHVVQEDIDMEDQSTQFPSFSMSILTNQMDDVSISGTIHQEDYPTFAIPNFDIQQYFFGDSEDLTAIRGHNQMIVNRYISENDLPSDTNLTLSTIPTGWMLGLHKEDDMETESDNQLSPSFATSTTRFSFDAESMECSATSSTSSSNYNDDVGFTDGDGGFGSD